MKKKVRKWIIIGIVLALAILIFKHYIDDLNRHIEILAKYNSLQNTEINKLNHEIALQSKEINNLQHQIKATPVKVESKPETHYSLDPITSAPTVIVTAVTIIGGLLKNLIPSF